MSKVKNDVVTQGFGATNVTVDMLNQWDVVAQIYCRVAAPAVNPWILLRLLWR